MNAKVERRISSWQRGSFEKGLAEGRAGSIIAVLEARGLALTEDQRERVLGCTDLHQLDDWLRRATAVADPATLFESPTLRK